MRAALSFWPTHGLAISPDSIVEAGRLRLARRERVPWFPEAYSTVGGRGRGDENASRGGMEVRCWRSTALFANEFCAVIICCASKKPGAAASPRLKLITLSGGVKGFVASMIGVEKGLAGVVAPLGIILIELP